MVSDVLSDAVAGSFAGSSMAGFVAFMLAFLFIFIILGIILYVIKSLALMKIAKKLKVKNAWLAWIPIGDFYLLTQTSKQSGWWTLLILGAFIPIIGGLFGLVLLGIGIWFLWITGERLKKSGPLSLLSIIFPLGTVIVLAIYAWSK